jgi:hypothetical protein
VLSITLTSDYDISEKSELEFVNKNYGCSWAPLTHTYNLSYSEGREQEDCEFVGSSLEKQSITKKRAGGEEHLLSKRKALSSNPVPPKK